jgi:acetolactate synthase regulatory subunit
VLQCGHRDCGVVERVLRLAESAGFRVLARVNEGGLALAQLAHAPARVVQTQRGADVLDAGDGAGHH